MKKIGLYTLATAVVAMLVGSAAIAAPAVTFSWTGTGTPVTAGGDFSFQSIVTASTLAPFTVGETGTATGIGSTGNFDFTLDGVNLIQNGDLQTFSFFGTEYAASTGAGGTLNLSYDPNTGLPETINGGFIAPAPETSSLVALSAVLAAGGLLLFVSKRKTSSMVA